MQAAPCEFLFLAYFFYMTFVQRIGSPTMIAALLGGLIVMVPTFYSAAAGGAHDAYALTFLWIAVVLIAAKVSGLIEKLGQPAVLGELLMGVALGNLALFGITIFEPIKVDPMILFFAELGVVILLFQIGLESNIKEMTQVGYRAVMVAIAGIVFPFALGAYIVGPYLMPGLDLNTYLFIGAALTATSVGITARVFKDLGKLKIKESQIVLGAAVIDDVMGLVILAVVTAMVVAGSITAGAVGFIVFKAIAFLGGAIIIGQITAPYVGDAFSRIHTGVGMKFALAFSVGLVMAYLANLIGLAPIIGAFAGGLILDEVTFKRFRRPEFCEELDEVSKTLDNGTKVKLDEVSRRYDHKHVENLMEPVAQVFVPIFFVVTGMMVDLTTFADTAIILTALGLTLAAIVGKAIAGAFAGKGVNRWVIGFGMVPRGEVGLIFATIGMGLGVITDGVFSAVIIMVIITTLITPPILSAMLKRM